MAIVITDGVPYPANRRQPAIDEAETLRMENSKSEVSNPLNFEFDFLLFYFQCYNEYQFTYYSTTQLSIFLYFKLDIGLYSVGITDEIDESFLAAISGDIGVTNGNQVLGYDYFKAPDFQALDSMLETVSAGICENPSNPKPSKCHFNIMHFMSL